MESSNAVSCKNCRRSAGVRDGRLGRCRFTCPCVGAGAGTGPRRTLALRHDLVPGRHDAGGHDGPEKQGQRRTMVVEAMTNGGGEALPIRSIEIRSQRMTMTVDLPHGPVVVQGRLWIRRVKVSAARSPTMTATTTRWPASSSRLNSARSRQEPIRESRSRAVGVELLAVGLSSPSGPSSGGHQAEIDVHRLVARRHRRRR